MNTPDSLALTDNPIAVLAGNVVQQLPSGPALSVPPVVLLHGIGGGKAQWAPQLELLSQRGLRTLAWDMPGYGGSALPAHAYTFEALASAFVRMLDSLSIGRAIAVGHSMGGMVALEAYARFPERFAGLVLACTSAAFGSADGEFQRRFVADRIAPLDAGLGMPGLAAEQAPRMMTPGAPRSAIEHANAVMGAVPESTYRAALACLVTFDRREILGRIDVPVLALAAASDAQAPPAGMEKMAGRIPGAEFIVLPDCAHLANFERPAAFAEAVGEFIARRCAG